MPQGGPMKKKIVIALFFLIPFTIVILRLDYLHRQYNGKQNIVNDLTPIHQISAQHELILDSFSGKTPSEISRILSNEWPTIKQDLINWLVDTGKLASADEVTSITFFYGSGTANGEDGHGNIHSGYFQNELIAQLNLTEDAKPLLVAVKCANGLFELASSNLLTISSDQLRFAIGKRKCLVDYVSFETAISLAKQFNLSIYKDKGKQRHKISPEEALKTDTDNHLIQILVFPGDEFDLVNMTYN